MTARFSHVCWPCAAIITIMLALCARQSNRCVALMQAETRVKAARTLGASSAARSNRLLVASIMRLEELNSLSTTLEFEADFFGKRYRGRGEYRELSAHRENASNSRKPLETNFSLRAQLREKDAPTEREESPENSIEIVCDCARRAWWRYEILDGAKSLQQINIEELANSLAQMDDQEAAARLATNGVDRACGVNGLPGLGGLPGMLKRLGAYYEFEPEVASVSSGRGLKSFKISGKAAPFFWDAARAKLESDRVDDRFRENLPDHVEIYFGTDWPFPYKITYYTILETEKKKQRRDVFSIQFSDVKLNDPNVRAEEFEYIQPQVNFERVTKDYLQELAPEGK